MPFDEQPPPSGASPGRGTSLSDLFPGNSGRMQFVRVMLRLMHPDLDQLPWDQPLPPDLLAQVKDAIAQDQRG